MSFDVHRLPVRLRKLPGSQQIHADPVGAYLRALSAIDPRRGWRSIKATISAAQAFY
jgi:hypothetical protein